jgi:Zinc finger, C2H2 type
MWHSHCSRFVATFSGVRPYRCTHCDKAFTQRCSLESHARKLHGLQLAYGYKQRRDKIYVCELCGFSADRPDSFHEHMTTVHPECPRPAQQSTTRSAAGGRHGHRPDQPVHQQQG